MKSKKSITFFITMGITGIIFSILLIPASIKAYGFFLSGREMLTQGILSLQRSPLPFILEYVSISLVIISITPIANIRKKSIPSTEERVYDLLLGLVLALFSSLLGGYLLVLLTPLKYGQCLPSIWVINILLGALFLSLIFGTIRGLISGKNNIKEN